MSGEGAHWGYTGDCGPDHWGDLCPEYRACALGAAQSPIDICAAQPSAAAGPLLAYGIVPLRISNNGHAIQVDCAPGNTMQFGDCTYELVQFHFHRPSEHLVAGRSYALELHLVHRAADGALAVIGVMLDPGAPSSAYDPVWEHLPAQPGDSLLLPEVQVDLAALLPTDCACYAYLGSLTTPPGSEGVQWFIYTQPMTLTPAQIAAFERLYLGNNRPVQPLNGRAVHRLDA
jgi:carbonic anhydrase